MKYRILRLLVLILSTLESRVIAQTSAKAVAKDISRVDVIRDFDSHELENYTIFRSAQEILNQGCGVNQISNYGLPPSGFPGNEGDLNTIKPYPAFYPVTLLPGAVCAFEQSTYLQLSDRETLENEIRYREDCVELQQVIRDNPSGKCQQAHRIFRRCCKRPA